MRKIILFTFTAIMFALPSKAQVNFGVKGGLNVTSISFSKSTFDEQNRYGFFIGPTLDINFKASGFGLDIACLYDLKNIGSTDPVTNTEMKETLQFVEVPLNFKFALGIDDLSNIYVATGPQLSWNIGDDVVFDRQYLMKSSLFSWNVGAGFTILKHFRAGYTYNIPCGKTAELKDVQNANQVVNNIDFRNSSHKIHFTYIF